MTRHSDRTTTWRTHRRKQLFLKATSPIDSAMLEEARTAGMWRLERRYAAEEGWSWGRGEGEPQLPYSGAPLSEISRSGEVQRPGTRECMGARLSSETMKSAQKSPQSSAVSTRRPLAELVGFSGAREGRRCENQLVTAERRKAEASGKERTHVITP